MGHFKVQRHCNRPAKCDFARVNATTDWNVGVPLKRPKQQ